MRQFFKYLRSLLPTKLPVGTTEFESFCDDIIELSGPYADRDSMMFAIGTMILHLGPTKSAVPKAHFVRALRKTAANQVAGHFFQMIKEKQKAAEELAKQQQAEATALTSSDNQSEPSKAQV